MVSHQDKNKRIAKNSLFLYMRMLILMFISLYTSRVILAALGVEDFGLYNVIGGVVTMFSLISGSISASITRFLNIEMGKGNQDGLQKIFNSALYIQFLLSLLILFLGESIGLWFLNNKMVIPQERLFASNWVYQFSLLSFIVNLISAPYNAAIIAHEKMSVFAYIGIYEGVSKLIVAYIISFTSSDRLILYSLLLFTIALSIRLFYGWYCKKRFAECIFVFNRDKAVLKDMFSFAGWNYIGAASGLLRGQGGNILINLFFGPSINAARGIAYQVNGAIVSFVTNFTTAINPQITQSYSNGDYGYMIKLVNYGAKLSYFVMFLLSLPIILTAPYILDIWLETVPGYAVLFVRLVLILTMWETISYPLITALLATGKIRNYQICVGGLNILNLPISYLLLRLGFGPEYILYVAIFLGQLTLFARLYFLRKLLSYNVYDFFKNIYLKVLCVSILSSFFPFIIYKYCWHNSFLCFILVCLISLISCSFFIWIYGLDRKEKSVVMGILAKFKKRLQK